jgi:hypothetical protein
VCKALHADCLEEAADSPNFLRGCGEASGNISVPFSFPFSFAHAPLCEGLLNNSIEMAQSIFEEFSGPVNHEFFFSSSNPLLSRRYFPKSPLRNPLILFMKLKLIICDLSSHQYDRISQKTKNTQLKNGIPMNIDMFVKTLTLRFTSFRA